MLLALPVFCLLQEPERLPSWATDLAAAPGWMAILLAVVAAAWYLRQVSPRNLVHVPGCLTLALGVLACCAAGGGMIAGADRPWLSYHVLTAAWAAAALAVLGIGWAGRKLQVAGQVDPALVVPPEKGTVPICRDQPPVGARPKGAAHKWGLSPFPGRTAAGRLKSSLRSFSPASRSSPGRP